MNGKKMAGSIKPLEEALWGESEDHKALLNLPIGAVQLDVITIDQESNPGVTKLADGRYIAEVIIFPDVETLRGVCTTGLKLADDLDREAKERALTKEGEDEEAPSKEEE